MFLGSATSVREFVALKDVSFDVPRGSCVGVIGPNGAGKSTLLKILAGIVEPTWGAIEMQGRIASIIELGAGFHPEFTGRENVFLNAALHGLSDKEARARYGEIAAFCELGSYLDMPVKTYSSGMFVRLAFAVAISAEPDILLVDEALAVGDAVFAHRCLGKIRELRETGVTIILVTHDTNTVSSLCDRALFLDRGQLVMDGPPKDVVHVYLLNVAERLTSLKQQGRLAPVFHEIGAQEESGQLERRFGTMEVRITDVGVEDPTGKPVEKTVSGEPLRFRMNVRFDKTVPDPVFGLMIRNRYGVEMFGTNTFLRKTPMGQHSAGEVTEVIFEMPMLLGAGAYTACFAVHTAAGHFYDYRVDALVFEVLGAHETIGMVNMPVAVTTRQIGRDELAPDNVMQTLYQHAPAELLLDDEASRFLSGEWYEPHPDAERPVARWMGQEAVVYLRVPENAAELHVEARTFYPEIVRQAVTVRLVVESHQLGIQPVGHPWSTLRFPLPESLPREQVVAVRLDATPVWSPADYNPDSADERKLSILVSAIQFAASGP